MRAKVRHSLSVTVVVFVVAAVVSLPLFFRHSVVTVDCPSGRCRVLQTSWLFRHSTFRTAYRVVWTTAGTFAPLAVLCVASAGLVTVLYRSRTAAIASPRRYPCTRSHRPVYTAVDPFTRRCTRVHGLTDPSTPPSTRLHCHLYIR